MRVFVLVHEVRVVCLQGRYHRGVHVAHTVLRFMGLMLDAIRVRGLSLRTCPQLPHGSRKKAGPLPRLPRRVLCAGTMYLPSIDNAYTLSGPLHQNLVALLLDTYLTYLGRHMYLTRRLCM